MTFDVLAFLRAASMLGDPLQRLEAAGELARMSGANGLMLFVRDSAIRRSLPVPGFPQTLRGASGWRSLLDEAIDRGTSEGNVLVAEGEPQPALALGLADGTVAVLTGRSTAGQACEEAVEMLRTSLPLLGAFFRVEWDAQRSVVEARMARQAAVQANDLVSRLDTARAALQEALSVAERANRARDEFLATVSHELRTPLTSIVGWVQLLRMEQDSTSISDGLETIERNAKSQTRLIEDLLDFSRINAGKLRLDVGPVDLFDVVNSAIEVIRPAAEAKGISLEAVLDPRAGLVSGDEGRLQQVVWNLLSNAVKFTRRKGFVRIKLERVESHSQLTVSDSGEGISPEFLPYVFDRFSQADGSSTRSHSGLGLGLGIVKHLVELHGGIVQAYSQGLGLGSSFVVRIPLIAARHQNEPRDPGLFTEGETGEALADLTGVSVLVVEDNDDSRNMLEAMLQRSGAKVRAADSVPMAMRMLVSGRPDIVISDIEMPGEDGYSLIRKMRLSERASEHVPAIALTAYARTADRVRALAAGFQTHMSKPVEPAELLAAVKSLITGQRKLGT